MTVLYFRCVTCFTKLCIQSLSVHPESICLAGYSFGAAIAFEMALQTERRPVQYPKIKSLVLLDGSPFLTKTLFWLKWKDNVPEENLEVKGLLIFSRMFDRTIQLDKEELLRLKSSVDRIRYTANKIVATFPRFQPKDIENAYELIKPKKDMILNYTPKEKLQMDVNLIKASDIQKEMQSFALDYDLDKICEGKITINTVKGNHYSILQYDAVKELAALLNEICSLSK